jgi:hypothetical protein
MSSTTAVKFMAPPPAEVDETFVEDLIRKLGIGNATLMSILHRRLLVEQKADARDLWRMLSLRGEVQALDIVAQIGDAISAEGIGRLLDIKKSAIHKAKQENRLLAFQLPARVGDFFPVFQIAEGKVLPWIKPLLDSVGNGMPAVQFLTVKRRSLNGASYCDLLRDDDHPEIVNAMLEHARGLGDPAAMPLRKLSKVGKAIAA